MTNWLGIILGLAALAALILLVWLAVRPTQPVDTRRLQQLVADLSALNARVGDLTEQFRQINAEARASRDGDSDPYLVTGVRNSTSYDREKLALGDAATAQLAAAYEQFRDGTPETAALAEERSPR